MIPPLQRPAEASLGSVPGRVCQPGSGAGSQEGQGSGLCGLVPVIGLPILPHCQAEGETESWGGSVTHPGYAEFGQH